MVERSAAPAAPADSLDVLLSEDASAAAVRARSSFDRLAAPCGDALVLVGAGGLGRKVLAGLRTLGPEPLAFVDNNPALWGTAVEGIQVLSPQAAAQRFAARAAFVVTIWRAGGTHRFEHIEQQFHALGCRTVVSFAHLFWKYPETFLPYYCLDLPQHVLHAAAEIRRAFALWADEASRREYVAQLRWRLWLDFHGLPSPVKQEQYFPEDLIRWSPDEVFVDCGAFDGDTLKSFLRRRGAAFGQFVALEPDPASFGRLKSYASSLEEGVRRRIALHRLAVGATAGRVCFDATGAASAAMSTAGNLDVEVCTLDTLLAATWPTYLKMDIEGAEIDALMGARAVIQQATPAVAACVYHRQDHLWRIPLLLQSLSNRYRFLLRPHNEECWDLVCYAIPEDRLKLRRDARAPTEVA